ncbi:MAG: hypothetical protein HC903_28705 [Methylacidiphilales bacterium]|nr:hypothetical protein [Candidatus Methylacidiphilales bacterium]
MQKIANILFHVDLSSTSRQNKLFSHFIDAERLPAGYGSFLLQSLAGRKPTPAAKSATGDVSPWRALQLCAISTVLY